MFSDIFNDSEVPIQKESSDTDHSTDFMPQFSMSRPPYSPFHPIPIFMPRNRRSAFHLRAFARSLSPNLLFASKPILFETAFHRFRLSLFFFLPGMAVSILPLPKLPHLLLLSPRNMALLRNLFLVHIMTRRVSMIARGDPASSILPILAVGARTISMNMSVLNARDSRKLLQSAKENWQWKESWSERGSWNTKDSWSSKNSIAWRSNSPRQRRGRSKERWS